MLIVVGGTIAATLIANPLGEVVGLIGVYMKAIKNTATIPTELIEKIVGFAETARREGILALEQAVEETDDTFLSGGVRLAVDGTEPDLIMDILETELQFIEERHKLGQEIIARMSDTAPAFGMIGTLVGLVIMLKNMDDRRQAEDVFAKRAARQANDHRGDHGDSAGGQSAHRRTQAFGLPGSEYASIRRRSGWWSRIREEGDNAQAAEMSRLQGNAGVDNDLQRSDVAVADLLRAAALLFFDGGG